MHILSPETDNCPSWISGRERMTVENIPSGCGSSMPSGCGSSMHCKPLSLSGLIQQTTKWYFFYIFSPRKQDLPFHANCFHWRQFAWNNKSPVEIIYIKCQILFSGKQNKKNISICRFTNSHKLYSFFRISFVYVSYSCNVYVDILMYWQNIYNKMFNMSSAEKFTQSPTS